MFRYETETVWIWQRVIIFTGSKIFVRIFHSKTTSSFSPVFRIGQTRSLFIQHVTIGRTIFRFYLDLLTVIHVLTASILTRTLPYYRNCIGPSTRNNYSLRSSLFRLLVATTALRIVLSILPQNSIFADDTISRRHYQ